MTAMEAVGMASVTETRPRSALGTAKKIISARITPGRSRFLLTTLMMTGSEMLTFCEKSTTPTTNSATPPRRLAPSTEWQMIREYFCPISGDFLDVEAPTPWYSVIHDFELDIDTFYRDWLGKDISARA
jgi:hypothetical protein